jgi:serine/threonine protein kinase
LFSKVIFASGGERKIRWVYDLTMGTFFLKKRITGLFEEQLLNYLLPLRLQRGIQTSVQWRTVSDKPNKEKRQIIESVRDGTLQTLFGTAPLSNFSVKRDLILYLLIDLNALHLRSLSGVTITQDSPFSNTQTQELSYHTFHSDIKPLNVLVFIQNGKWRAELCDFGFGAAHPVAFVISIGFTPPEYIRFYQEKRPLGIGKVSAKDSFDIAQFNIKHGHGRDVWDLGLVIISLLIEREVEAVWINVNENCRKRTNIPPLPCLQAMLSDRIFGHYDEKGILDIKQETLDADLDQLEREIAYKHPQERTEVARVSEMLKKMMLRINPTERKTVADCIAFMQQEPLKTV